MLKIRDYCSKGFERLLTATIFLSVLILAWIVIIMVSDVILRYFFDRPLAWSMDIAGYSLFGMTFISAAWILKREGHVTVRIFSTYLKPRYQAVLNIITSITSFLISVVFCWEAALNGLEAYRSGTKLFTSVMFPKYILLWVMSFSMLLVSIQLLQRAWQFFEEAKILQRKSE